MNKLKFGIGILLGIFFMYLALRKVEFAEVWNAFKSANYWYLAATIPVIFLSYLLRALRWRYLLDPIKRLDIQSLLSALIIGQMANVLMPAHLGEIVRAYVLSKKRRIAASTNFATIVMERVIDVFSLLFLTLFAIFIHPFPDWIKNSAYIMFAGVCGIFTLMVLLKKLRTSLQAILRHVLRPLPARLLEWMENAIERFIYGIRPLRQPIDYITVPILSVLIWACYALVIHLTLCAFDFYRGYHLPWSASIILLVITTIAIVIPSSPGYVGTFHYLCQISLAMYSVPASPAVSFATVLHAINFIPVLVLGLILFYYEGIQISKVSEKKVIGATVPEIS